MIKFLSDVQTILSTIRKDCKPKKSVDKSEDVVVAILDDEDGDGNDDEPDSLSVDDNTRRRTSGTLMTMLKARFPKIQCDDSDSACLLHVTAGHVHEPTMSTQIKVFSSFTSIFKQYYVDRGETLENSDYINTVRDVLRSAKEVVLAEQYRKSKAREDRLADRFVEHYNNVVELCIDGYNGVMGEDVINYTLDDMGRLLVSLQIATGSRKIEILDPNIKFKRLNKKYDTLNFGVENSDNRVASVDREKFNQPDHIIMQQGVAKDKAQRINKYITRENNQWVPNKNIIKPTIILTAQQVINGVDYLRRELGITITTFTSRDEVSNGFKYGDVAVKEMFKASAAKAESHGWQFGTHHARKIYADASFKIYSDQIRRLTNKNIDRSIWARAVLAHEGGLETTLSYANVDVEFAIPNKLFDLPPDEQVRLLQTKIESLKKTVEDHSIQLTQCFEFITTLFHRNGHDRRI